MCDHRDRRITGVYPDKNVPKAVGWDCLVCRTSGLILWEKATEEQRREALLIWRGEMAVEGMTG